MSGFLKGFDIKRIVLYFFISFGVSMFSTYAIAKKVFNRMPGGQYWIGYNPYEGDNPGADEILVDLPNSWPDAFAQAATQATAIPQNLIDIAHPSPDGKYIYYSRVGHRPRAFSDKLLNFDLWRYSLETRKEEPVATIGYVRFAQLLFTPDDKLVVRKHDEDTDGDGQVGQYDLDSVWLIDPGAKDDAKRQRKICILPEATRLYGLDTAGGRLILYNDQKAYYYSMQAGAPNPEELIFEGYQLAFALRGDNWFICYRLTPEGKKKFFHYSCAKKSFTPIELSAPQAGTEFDVVFVKDVRSKIIYLQSVDTEGKGRVWGLEMEKGAVKPLTPANLDAQFYAASSNGFVIFSSGVGAEEALYCVTPSVPQPRKLFTYGGQNITSMKFNMHFETLAFVKTIDGDGDGAALSLKDPSEVHLLSIWERKQH